MSIRPIAERELELVERQLPSGSPEKHRLRLALQRAGQVVYLVAWQGDTPVGHALLIWRGSPHEPIASRLRDCPDIEDLWVSPDHRSRGIGSQLLSAAEGLVRQRGYPRVGLGVAVGNTRARALYERRGYRESGLGPFQHGVSPADSRGPGRLQTETDVYLVKELS